jgi:hypothetical protein
MTAAADRRAGPPVNAWLQLRAVIPLVEALVAIEPAPHPLEVTADIDVNLLECFDGWLQWVQREEAEMRAGRTEAQVARRPFWEVLGREGPSAAYVDLMRAAEHLDVGAVLRRSRQGRRRTAPAAQQARAKRGTP